MDNPKLAPHVPAAEEFYVEPAELKSRDIAGVVLALVALALIGVSGYIWLTPEIGFKDISALLTREQQSSKAEPSVASLDADAMADKPDSCPYCGMFTTGSTTHILAEWSDKSSTHHDCWDCTFSWGRQEGLELTSAKVVNYDSGSGDKPGWLDAAAAWFLYDTVELKGSMPPYVAAFADRASAEAAQAELGGELLDWTALRERMERDV